jgi:rhamnogalacturonan endolyase
MPRAHCGWAIPQISTASPLLAVCLPRRAGAMRMTRVILLLSILLPGLSLSQAKRQPAEALDRGLVAVKTADGKVFVSWRLLAEDEAEAAFDVYRVRDGKERKVNGTPLTAATSLTDAEAGEAYVVKKLVAGKESGSAKAALREAARWEIPLQLEPGYQPGDCSAGDLNGDGSYEIILHQTKDGKDNSFVGITGEPLLEAYQLDGKRLWRINLGRNIREGEHYTQFVVYDLDGDGKAELACKTADGTVDGTGAVIGDATKDWRHNEEGSQKHGRILSGPEFLTIFDGATGRALKTVPYVPGRDPMNGWGGNGGNGGNDEYGNRCDRFLACVAYLDGERPSLVMARGVYGRTVLAAWDWRGGELKQRWVFDSGIAHPPYENVSKFSGMGGHSLIVADVDADGRDEIVYQAMTVDDDGKGLYSTGRRHGDTLHLSDFDPERPGLELFLTTENEERTVRWQTPGIGLHDARTGELLWSDHPGVDVPRGIVADIDPRHPGAEIWGVPGGLLTIKGKPIGPAPRFADWVIWWDGDLLREIYAGMTIQKWDWEAGRMQEIFAAPLPEARGRSGRRVRAGTRPHLSADLFGDWREEILLPGPDGKSLRLYTSTIPTEHRMVSLMQDPQYRLSVVWQNVAYNKPPNTTRFIGGK